MTRLSPARTLWFRLAPVAEAADFQTLILEGLVSVPAVGPPERLGEGALLGPNLGPNPKPDPHGDRDPNPARSDLVLIRAAHPSAGDVAAVLLVAARRPGSCARVDAGPLTVNGVGVGEGMHLLRHGDCVVRGDLKLWLSVDRVAQESLYDPEVDGRDVFCARTKLRLATGDPIVRCPGTPSRGCDLVYRASTWDASLSCHQCGHDPSAPRWTPPTPGGQGSLTSRLQRLLHHASHA